MILNPQPYPKMKDSGVEWIGSVPAHWSVMALRNRYHQCLGKMLDSKRITGEHLVPYLRNTDVQWGRVNVSNLPVMDIHPNEFERYTLRGGDLVVCEGGEVGRGSIWQGELDTCGFQKALHRLRPHQTERDLPRFLLYALQIAAERGAFYDGHTSTIEHLTGEKLRSHRFAFPPATEQHAIAGYLDHAVRHIQRYISAKQKLIALLEEQQQTIIDQAMTGKTDHRTGEPHAERRAVAGPWLRALPEQWRLARLKEVANVQTGLTLGKDYRNTATVTHPYLRVANVQHGHLDLTEVKKIDVPLNEARRTTLSNGDVLMTEGGDIDKLGRGCLWMDEVPDCLHQNHVFAVRCKRDRLMPEFLVGLMRSYHGRAYFQLTAKQTTNLASTNSTTLRAFPIPLPPVNEQREILNKVSEETRTIHAARTRIIKEIELVREYRACLIANVVTGKLDVRKAVAPLPDVDRLREENSVHEAKIEPADGKFAQVNAGFEVA